MGPTAAGKSTRSGGKRHRRCSLSVVWTCEHPRGQSQHGFLDEVKNTRLVCVCVLPSCLQGDTLPLTNDLSTCMQAARKRPALANMLSHRWLQPLTPPSTSPSSAPSSAPCQQMVVSATLLPGPPGPPLLTAAPTEPSSSGLTPTEAPGLQSMNPHPDEDRHHGGVSRNATAFEVMSISSESMAAHSESRSGSMLC